MSLENNQIQDKLTAVFSENVFQFRQEKDIFTFNAASDIITSIILFLKNDETLNFHFLTDVCGIHYPDSNINEQFAVVYHLHNWIDKKRIRIKCFINGENPEIKTISTIFLCANWMERETWDFYGINFIGHPQLKRILNMDEMISHPMRKEFPMEDSGRTDKDDRFFGRTTINA